MLLDVANRSGAGVSVSRKLAGAMPLLQIDIRLIAASHTVAVVVRELLHNFGGSAEHETARRDDCALSDDGAGADNASAADHGVVEDNRADANQAIVLDFGAVDYGPVADGHSLANRAGDSGVGVQYRAVLDVGVFIDGDLVGVGADYGGGPDAGVSGESYLAEDNCGFVDKSFGVDFHFVVAGDYGACRMQRAATRCRRGVQGAGCSNAFPTRRTAGQRPIARFLLGGRRGSVLKREACG